MYTLAIDRGDEQVADLYDPLHPGVLRLIQLTVDAANRRGIDVGMRRNGRESTPCSFVGRHGIAALSMTPNSLPRVKQRIRHWMGRRRRGRAQTILDQYDPERVSALIGRVHRGVVGSLVG